MYAILLLCLISVIAFWLSRQVPGDAVMDYISIDEGGIYTSDNPLNARDAYERVAHKRGLDLPPFYFTVSPAHIPDSVHRILPFADRDAVRSWIVISKDGKTSLLLYHQLISGLMYSCSAAHENFRRAELCQFYHIALTMPDPDIIRQNAVAVQSSFVNDSLVDKEIIASVSNVIETINMLVNSPSQNVQSQWIPQITWHGTDNQYHQWMTSLLTQRPLISLADGRNAWSKIYDAFKWTLLLNGFALLFAIVLGTLIGVWSATHDGKRSERITNWILFALFALPSFWLGTLFIYFFASGEWLAIFPPGGLGSHESADNFLQKLGILFTHFFLPVTCLTAGALAYVSRQMKQSIQHEFGQPYVSSLKTLGVSDKTIVRRHVIKNALFPLITIIGGSVPALLSGSLVIEVIFSIPGMGRLMFNSLLAQDWPVVFPILMLGALITIVSYILTDLIYKWADPRVKTIES